MCNFNQFNHLNKCNVITLYNLGQGTVPISCVLNVWFVPVECASCAQQ